jgi:hypothetical protein
LCCCVPVKLPPEDSPKSKEWTAEQLIIEGEHIFMELVRLLRSVELHEDAKVTVKEIVSTLSEVSCAARPEGLREVLIADSSSHQRVRSFMNFTAAADDEVTVTMGG